MKLYKNLGMLRPQRWRMCVEKVEFVNELRMMKPIDYNNCDRSSDRMCFCRLRTFLQKYPMCFDTCTECGIVRKDMIPIDYSPIAP
jgi:hypothetical protein